MCQALHLPKVAIVTRAIDPCLHGTLVRPGGRWREGRQMGNEPMESML